MPRTYRSHRRAPKKCPGPFLARGGCLNKRSRLTAVHSFRYLRPVAAIISKFMQPSKFFSQRCCSDSSMSRNLSVIIGHCLSVGRIFSSGDIGRSTAGTAPERYSSEYTPPRRDGCTSVGAPRVPGPQSSLILPDEAETADLGQRDADQCKAIAQLQVLSVNPVEMPAADVGPCDNREPQAPAHMRQHVCRIRCVIVQCFFHRCCI